MRSTITRNNHSPQQPNDDDDVEEDEVPDAINVDTDICNSCNASTPPKRKGGRRIKNKTIQTEIKWVECEPCGRWYHCSCVGYKRGEFVCELYYLSVRVNEEHDNARKRDGKCFKIGPVNL